MLPPVLRTRLLDYAAADEGRLLRAGVPGLTPAWSNEHWHVFAVAGSTGIAGNDASVQAVTPSGIDLVVSAPGSLVVRVRDNGHWFLAGGHGCVASPRHGWLALQVASPGPIRLVLRAWPTQRCRERATSLAT